MNNILEQLREKEAKLADLRNKEERRKGQCDQLLQQLSQEFALDSVEQASEKLKEVDLQIHGLDGELTAIDTEMAGIITAATSGGN